MQNESGNSTQSMGSFTVALLAEEKCRSLYGNLPASIAVSALIAFILSLAHWSLIGHAEVILWNLILGFVLVARLMTWMFWTYAKQAYPNTLWLRLFRTLVWLTGIAWGLSSYFLFSPESAMHQALLAYSIAGVASGSLTSLTIDRSSAVGFVVFMVFPLSLTLYQHSGPGAVSMLTMSILFVAFVLSSTRRAQQVAEDRIVKNIELTNLANALQAKQIIEDIINASQSKFIEEKNSIAALNFMLQKILPLTGSTLGFIGKILHDELQKPMMQALLFAGEESIESELLHYYRTQLPEGGKFRNMGNLFGSAIETGKPVISNNPNRDLRAGGLPSGHPALSSFLAIPIYIGTENIALLGLANKPGGYSDDDIEQLNPILSTIAQFVQAVSNEADHAKDKAALTENSQSSRIIMDNVSDGIITIDKQGVIRSMNAAAETIFGYNRDFIIRKNISALIPDPDRSKHQDYINQYIKHQKSNVIDKGREVIGLRKNGVSFPMELFISMVIHNNEPVFIGIIRDISEKKQYLNRRNENTHNALTELALQQLALTKIAVQQNNRELLSSDVNTDITSSLPYRSKHLYELITKYFFIEHNKNRTPIHMAKKLKEIIDQARWILPPNNTQLNFDENRQVAHIQCDEKLFKLCIILLLNNLVYLGLTQLTISIREEKSMARITMEAKIDLADTDTEDSQFLTINNESNPQAQDIAALVSLYSGKIMLHHTTKFEHSISIEFPLTVSR